MNFLALLPAATISVLATSALAQDASESTNTPINALGGPLSTLVLCTILAAVIVVVGGYFVMQARHARGDDNGDPGSSDPPNA